MGRLGGDGAASGGTGGGRLSADTVSQTQKAYADQVRRKNRLNELNLASQGKSSYDYASSLELAKKARDEGDISNDDFMKFAKGASQLSQGRIQQKAQDTFNKNTSGPERFVAGIGGMVNDSIIKPFINTAKNVQTGLHVAEHNVAETIVNKSIDDANKTVAADLAKGRITQAQARGKINANNNYKTAFNAQGRADEDAFQKIDPGKAAGDAAGTVLNLAGGSIVKDVAAKGIGAGLKVLGGNAAKEAAVGAATGVAGQFSDKGKDIKPSDILTGAGLGAAFGAAVPTAGRLARGGGAIDKAVGGRVAEAATRLSSHEGILKGLNELKNDGLIGGIDKAVSNVGKKISYAAGDAIKSTKVGAKAAQAVDNFNSRFVTNMHDVYKVARRTDFEGKTQGGEAAITNAVNDAYRSTGFAKDIVDSDSGIKKWSKAITSQGGDVEATVHTTDTYIAARQEKELLDSGAKKPGAKAVEKINNEWEAAKALPNQKQLSDAYDGLVEAYSNKLDRDYKNGFIEEDAYNKFKADPHDYIRVQREQPEWKVNKPGAARGGGQKMSVGQTQIVQKRNAHASGDQLSPIQTYLESVQYATKKHYENVAAKTVYSVLKEGGRADVKLLRSSDAVLQKRALLHDAHESNLSIGKLTRSLKSNKATYTQLAKEVNALKKQGNVRVVQELNKAIKALRKEGDKDPSHPFNAREAAEALATIDHKDFRKLRTMIERRNAKMEPVLDTIESINRELNDEYARKNGLLSDIRGLHINPDLKNVEHFEFMEKGIKNVVRTDPAIGAALKGYNKELSNVLVKWLQIPTTVFKMGTTTVNVAFAAVNLPKDLFESAVNSQRIFSTHLNPVNHFAVLAATLGRPIGPEEAALLKKFQAANKGGRMVDIYRKPVVAAREALNVANRDASMLQKTYTYIKHPRRAGQQFIDLMDETIGKTEDYTRYLNWRGTYMKALKSDRSPAEAFALANKQSRENSINFLEHGDVGQVLNAFLPYFNAAVQSGRQLARKFRDQPVSTLTKVSALITTPVAVSTYWNTTDEKRRAVYNTIPDYVKEGNFVIVTDGAKQDDNGNWAGVKLIPKPIGYGSLSEPIRKFIEWQADQAPKDHADMGKFLLEKGGSVAGDFVNSFNPVDFSSPDKFLSSIVPQALKPTAESIINKDFYSGEDIVKGAQADLPPEDQKYANYSKLTTYLGAVLNTSPLKIDHWIKGTFGEVGANGQNLIDRYVLGGKDKQKDADGKTFSDIGGRSLPQSLERRFGNPPGKQDQTAFYDTYNPVAAKQNRVSQQITALVGQGKTAEAKRRAEDFNNSIGGYFQDFKKKYGNSPTYNKDWDENVEKLKIKTSDQAFKSRLRSYQKQDN